MKLLLNYVDRLGGIEGVKCEISESMVSVKANENILKCCIEMNDKGEVSRSLVWDSRKTGSVVEYTGNSVEKVLCRVIAKFVHGLIRCRLFDKNVEVVLAPTMLSNGDLALRDSNGREFKICCGASPHVTLKFYDLLRVMNGEHSLVLLPSLVDDTGGGGKEIRLEQDLNTQSNELAGLLKKNSVLMDYMVCPSLDATPVCGIRSIVDRVVSSADTVRIGKINSMLFGTLGSRDREFVTVDSLLDSANKFYLSMCNDDVIASVFKNNGSVTDIVGLNVTSSKNQLVSFLREIGFTLGSLKSGVNVNNKDDVFSLKLLLKQDKAIKIVEENVKVKNWDVSQERVVDKSSIGLKLSAWNIDNAGDFVNEYLVNKLRF